MIFLKITLIDSLAKVAILYYIYTHTDKRFFLFYDARGQLIIGCNNYTFYSLHILYNINVFLLGRDSFHEKTSYSKRHCMDLRTV
jgi:hypothetical protein